MSPISDTFLNFSYVTPKPILRQLPHPHLRLTKYKVTELEQFLFLLTKLKREKKTPAANRQGLQMTSILTKSSASVSGGKH